MLVALGVSLRDAAGREVAPGPEGLATLARVDASALDPRLAACAITIMSDVNNPLAGEHGATAIFGPQKGVQPTQVRRFDDAIAHFASVRGVGDRHECAAIEPGAGAAGGLGFALQLLGGNFRSGAEVVADLIGLDAALAGADWAITGEGRSDAQTLLRKAPIVVAERARCARCSRHIDFGCDRSRRAAGTRQALCGMLWLAERPVDAGGMHRERRGSALGSRGAARARAERNGVAIR